MTDNEIEFTNIGFKDMRKSIGIKHHMVGVEDHRSDGRAERVIKTIR